MPAMIADSTMATREERDWKERLLANHIDNPRDYASFVLGKVSRTFALNIHVLPASLRRQVLLAYLFCRMADTLEDDTLLLPQVKTGMLRGFAGLFREGIGFDAQFHDFQSSLPVEWKDSEKWDHLLLYHSHWIFNEYHQIGPKARAIIARCVVEMCNGMAEFAHKQHVIAKDDAFIETVEELDRYCYFVAGTVGIMLGELFATHTPLIGASRLRKLKALSVSFGLGLQLTNILKDIQADGERNISFIPGAMLRERNLNASVLLLPQNRREAEPVLHALIDKARLHLEDALEYSCLLPRFEPRLRLFCLWPLFMAVETLVLAAENQNALRPEVKVKIKREQVERIIRITGLACWSNFLLRRLFRKRLERLDAALSAYLTA